MGERVPARMDRVRRHGDAVLPEMRPDPISDAARWDNLILLAGDGHDDRDVGGRNVKRDRRHPARANDAAHLAERLAEFAAAWLRVYGIEPNPELAVLDYDVEARTVTFAGYIDDGRRVRIRPFDVGTN